MDFFWFLSLKFHCIVQFFMVVLWCMPYLQKWLWQYRTWHCSCKILFCGCWFLDFLFLAHLWTGLRLRHTERGLPPRLGRSRGPRPRTVWLGHTDSGQPRVVAVFASVYNVVWNEYLHDICFPSCWKSLLNLLLRKKWRKRKWVHEINESREYVGEYHRLCRELQSHEDKFFTYFRMSRDCFEELHQLLEPKISKVITNWRRPICSKERLAISRHASAFFTMFL